MCGIVLAYICTVQSGMHHKGFHVMHHVMQLVLYLLCQLHFRKICLLLLKEQTFWYSLTRKKGFCCNGGAVPGHIVGNPDGIFQNHKISHR